MVCASKGAGRRKRGVPTPVPAGPRSRRCTGRSRAGGRPLALFASGHSRVEAMPSRKIAFGMSLVGVCRPAYWALVQDWLPGSTGWLSFGPAHPSCTFTKRRHRQAGRAQQALPKNHRAAQDIPICSIRANRPARSRVGLHREAAQRTRERCGGEVSTGAASEAMAPGGCTRQGSPRSPGRAGSARAHARARPRRAVAGARDPQGAGRPWRRTPLA